MSQRQDLERYLLGDLDEEQTLELDRRALGDDGFAERLAIAEEALIDALARGSLDDRRARRVAARLEASAEGRERLAFARALAARVARSDGGAKRPARPRRRSRRVVLAWAAAVALALGGGWLTLRGPDGGTDIPAFVLAATVRAGGETPRFVLSAQAPSLRLDIDLEGVIGRAEAAGARFRVIVRNLEGAVVAEQTDLRIEDTSQPPALGIVLDARPDLTGPLDLILERLGDGRPGEILGHYRFEIAREAPAR